MNDYTSSNSPFLTLAFAVFLLFLSSATAQDLHHPLRITPRGGAQHVDLSQDWKLQYLPDSIADPSQLPGKDRIIVKSPTSVQMAYYHAGKLPNPYQNLNSKEFEWMERQVWYYSKSFSIPSNARDKFVFLGFEGLDYFSKIWLNGVLLGTHEGMWGGPAIEVSQALRWDTENELVVEIKGGNYGQWKEFDWRHPGTIIKSRTFAGGGSHKPFFALGMWRGVRLDIVPGTHIERPYLTTESVGEDSAHLRLRAEVFFKSHSLQHEIHPWPQQQLGNYSNIRLAPQYLENGPELSVQIEFLDNKKRAFQKQFPVNLLQGGRTWMNETFTLPQPKPWYPNGLGEPNLYQVRVSLLKAGEQVDQVEFDYGIRKLERKPSPGPQTMDRWTDWQFVVNNKPFFVKGINWMSVDPLYDFDKDKYDWLLQTAKDAGIQMIRVWGGGALEIEDFYEKCNALGILIWQDFPKANNDTPGWDQQAWEAQVVHNIYRLRNHPSLAVWCGGNEFNPYTEKNAATCFIMDRNVRTLDPGRFWIPTSPDYGAVHLYPDFDPTWYAKKLGIAPIIMESGIHSIPEPSTLYEIIDPEEFEDLGGMYEESFRKEHPEFVHHFMEYSPARVPRMLSRASHVEDMSDPTLESISEATQLGAGEFYQIMSEGIQANYPVTTGLFPWVFKRPWPIVAAIHLLDGFGQPSAPYYFLKRTYEPTHISVQLPRLFWSAGEQLPLKVKVHNTNTMFPENSKAMLAIYDDSFKVRWQESKAITQYTDQTGDWGNFTIPNDYYRRIFFIVAELKGPNGELVSRSVYWPRCIPQMEDNAWRQQYITSPQPWPTLDNGPWLKPTVAANKTQLTLSDLQVEKFDLGSAAVSVLVSNTGKYPAFNTHLDIIGTKRLFRASDNFFWLAPGEKRRISLDIKWREEFKRSSHIQLKSWNSNAVKLKIR